MKQKTITATLVALAIVVLLQVSQALSAPTASASSLGPRQEVQQLHQQSGEPALTSLTVTADGTTQPLAPAFSSTVRYYTVVVDTAVTRITVSGTAAPGNSVAYQETDGMPIDDADTTANGHQVDIPTAGKRLDVVVTRTAPAATTTYGVLVIREGPSAADTVALMALYNSAGGENWLRTLNWGTAEPINVWADVITDSDGRVTNLRQPNNNMTGALPDELGSLTELQYLYLNDNQLSGPVPASLANLTKLVDFYLRANDFSGPLPDFSGFTNLRLLELQGNNFTGPIPNLSGLTQLQKLWLQDNALSGSIPDLASLTSLTNLSLSDNTLKGSIPSSLSSLTKLRELDLWGNELSGPIPDLSGLTELTYLVLSSNQLTGEIAWLGDLTKLTTVYLWGNELSGPIPDLTGLTALTYVSLSQNKLTGEIPASLGTLTKMVELYLWGNELSGPIPDLSGLSLLFELSLAQNELEGPVPAWLNGLTNLQGLWLNSNELTGSIPDLSALQKLFQLELSANQLGGEIPASLGTLSELQILGLRENNLTGQIPNLAGLQKLFYLELTRNQLDGTIPASLAEITGLQYVYLEENQLTGEIPAELGELTLLKGTRFANNALTGCVPHGLRVLLAAEAIETGIAGQVAPAQDFIAVDANGDGDTDDEGDVPGLSLPFCMLSALTLSDATLDPAFAPNTATYTAESTVASTTVTATLNDPDDQVSIKKGATSYNSVDAVPLEVGPNLITIEVTPSDARLLKQTYTVEVFGEGSAQSDREALIALYNSTGGSGWTNNDDWDSAQGLSTWFGVAVNGNGRVTELDLSGNNLRGTVPAQLATLTELTSLDLSGNQLSGAIPSELSDLTELTSLHLWGNELSGPIPDLSGLTELTILSLSNNQLTGEIAWLGALTELTTVYLWGNELSGTIPDLSSLTALTTLDLGDNLLMGEIPASLGTLTKLTTVYLWGNELSGPIPDLSGLTALTHLSLSQNKLTGEIPASLGTLTKIVELYLWGNELSGQIPDLSGLSLLFELSLSQNELEGPVPAWLNGLTNLQGLWLNSNELTGSIPDLSALQGLFALELQGNRLSGPIPASLGTLRALQVLRLSDNQLTEQIPDLGGLESLSYLELSRNQLSGSIPASLAQITGMRYVYLEENQLTGEIPADLGAFTKLEGARFANTGLTGCVPHGLRFLLALATVDRGYPGQEMAPAQDFIAVDANGDGDTDDEGDVPGLNLPFCMLSALTLSDATLDPVFAPGTAAYTATSTVAFPMVTATLNDPDDQVSIKKGATSYNSVDAIPLEAGLNLITIEVTPSDARLLKQTYTVEVFHPGSAATDRAALIALYNSTGGSGWTNNDDWDSAQGLSTWFGVIVNGNGRVTELDLADNNLRGTLPAKLATLTELASLDLSGNQLSGAIPSELGDISELTSLDLSGNQLSGAIPSELGRLTRVSSLDLSGNRLNGPIPAELGDLGFLRDLYLDDNQLTGEIPAELGHLTNLDVLHLNDNQLSGTIPPELGDISFLMQLSLRNNRLSGAIPASLGNFLRYARFANNAFTGCVPNGLRHLLTQPEFAPDVPAHDFALDANRDGDTADPGDIAGLTLPFCGLRELTLGGLTLEPAFASGAEAYTASAAHAVTSTTVTANLNESMDDLSITKGADTYADGDPVPLDVGTHLITIEVTTSDGSTTPHTYSVAVTRAPNAPPVFDDGRAATRGVDEDTFADQNIGDPLRATDADSADTLTYSLDTASDAFFDIDATTGQLRTEAALDHETRKSYPVTVSVSDGKDANGDADPSADTTITVTILVSDVNEDPSFALANDTRTIAENTPAGVTLGAPFTATDGDGDILTYSLGAGSAEYFEIDAAYGQLRTRAVLDYETTSSYSLTVTATDPSADSNSITVTVTVENVEEPGAVMLSSVQPRVGDTLFADLTDPDVVSGAVTWAWERSTSRTSGWTAVVGAASASYPTVDPDANYYLRVTASYDDGAGDGKSASAVSANPVRALASGNANPSFLSGTNTRTVDENERAGANVGAPVVATDADNDRLSYFLSGTDAAAFEINSSSGQLRTRAVLDYEVQQTYRVTVTATDPSGGSDEVEVMISVGNVQEAGTVVLLPLQPVVGIELTATLADPDGRVSISSWSWERSPDRAAWTPVSGARADYTPAAADVGAYLRATATYEDGADTGQTAKAVSAHPVREPRGRHTPVFTDGESTTRGTTKTTPPGVNIGAPVAATDGDNDRLSYSLGGIDAVSFDIDEPFGQLRTKADLSLDVKDSYTVNVEVTDGKNDQGAPDPAIDATIEVTITITTGPVRPVIIIGGGGGGGPSGPSPSKLDFEWTVKRDIDELDSDHDTPSGLWSDGTTLWLAENGDGADDAIYAYDLKTGERVEEREFELAERNRAPRGVWSNGTTLWVADSGQDKLFAHDLGSGERLPDSDIELAERNADPRGIWADDDRSRGMTFEATPRCSWRSRPAPIGWPSPYSTRT